MSNSVRPPFEPLVRDLVARLVRRDYAGVVARTSGRLTAEEIAAAVSEYGATLVETPETVGDLLDVVEVRGDTSCWSIHVPLWSAEEGRSDLTLRLTVRASDSGDFLVDVDDLHVL